MRAPLEFGHGKHAPRLTMHFQVDNTEVHGATMNPLYKSRGHCPDTSREQMQISMPGELELRSNSNFFERIFSGMSIRGALMAQNKFGPALLILLSVGPALLLFRAVGLSMQIAFSYDHLGQIIVNSPPMAFSTLVVASVAGLSGVTMFGNKYSRVIGIVGSLQILILGITVAAVMFQGKRPADTLMRTISRASSQKGCRLYTQGFPASVPYEDYKLMKETCPGIAESRKFHVLQNNISAVIEEESAIRGAETLSNFIYLVSTTFPGKPIICQTYFPVCNPVDCTELQPCNVFNTAYYNRPYELREAELTRQISPEVLERDMASGILFMQGQTKNIQQLQASVWAINNVMYPVMKREWKNQTNYCGVTTAKPDLCNPNEVAHSEIKNVKLNDESAEWENNRVVAAIASILSALLLFLSVATGKLGLNYNKMSLRRCTSRLFFRLTAGAYLVFAGAVSIYGGCLLEDAGVVAFTSGLYYFVGILAIYFGVYFSMPQSHVDRGFRRRARARSGRSSMSPFARCSLAVTEYTRRYKYGRYLMDCSDPENPQFLYRVILSEVLEAVLQIGALMTPQRVNAYHVLAATFVIAFNAVAMSFLLFFHENSPRRVRNMVLVEMVCDAYFMFFGIIRLQSNINITFVEHLAFLKPVFAFGFDGYNLMILTHMTSYQVRASTVYSIRTRNTFSWPSIAQLKKRKGYYSFLVVLPAVLLFYSAMAAKKFAYVAQECLVAVGKIAECASEKHYFDVANGINGELKCNFKHVRNLMCSNRAILTVPPNICEVMPRLKNVDLSSNPDLDMLPESFGDCQGIKSLNISHTAIKNFPPKLAFRSALSSISIDNTPCSRQLDWSYEGLTTMPPKGSAFYKTFAPTLEHWSVSGNNLDKVSLFCFLPNLKHLNISKNKLTGLHEDGDLLRCDLLYHLADLRVLDARGNNITHLGFGRNRIVNSQKDNMFFEGNPLDTIVFSGLQSRDGNAVSRYIRSLSSDYIKKLVLRTSEVDLRWFKISGDWPQKWIRLTSFTALSASFINATLADISSFKRLSGLDIPGTQIEGDIAALRNLRELESLRIYNNKIYGAFSELVRLTRLKQIAVSENNGLRGNIKLFLIFKHVELLSLYSTNFYGSYQSFSGLTNLQHLIVHNVNTTGEMNFLCNLTNLQSLTLRSSGLTGTLECASRLQTLDRINLDQNGISGPLTPLSRLQRLHHIMISTNNLSGSINVLTMLTALTRLKVNDNPLLGGNISYLLEKLPSLQREFVDIQNTDIKS